MKPPRLYRHSLTCGLCNRKRRGDRPMDYRWYVWAFWTGKYNALGEKQYKVYGGEFRHIACWRAYDVARKLLQ